MLWKNACMPGICAAFCRSRGITTLALSRSFLSFPRHEYFRRILCNLLGSEADRGELPDDFDALSGLVRDICFGNAKRLFGFDV